MKKHLLLLVGGGALALVALLTFGVNVSQALPVALAIACPLSMIAMMFFMNRSGGHGHGRGHVEHGPAEHQNRYVASRDDHERIP
ncbi:hypothetical protein GCM10023065_13380 [Microbacterium laevaniformans]|uniref:DUF2933 domain-containing protein n=1 Tax=Microbacterium laevaniformans TaxID=36807 RepID=A0A150HBP2_9MICO|nr:hypothetical protein [Microbacterium laevaniformans]KXZ59481.1 hypothetical protein Mlaev_02212 [Microbacterium laevaniformans]MBM7752287.1 hypothetical protein [Microbacterium laevaniformans]GLJ64658.1 hypothetical protein GCM10017578_15470 [Microbacterium laevaniformans]